jgi:hypothetical protein
MGWRYRLAIFSTLVKYSGGKETAAAAMLQPFAHLQPFAQLQPTAQLQPMGERLPRLSADPSAL